MSDVLGVGIDLCDIARMERLMDGPFLRRYFTQGEQDYVRSRGKQGAESLAGLFAAKEAALKALGTGITVPLNQVEIDHTEKGQPVCRLHGQAADLAQGGQLLVSITHEAGMAAAVCLWVREESNTEPLSPVSGPSRCR